jgi:hypothetical protein
MSDALLNIIIKTQDMASNHLSAINSKLDGLDQSAQKAGSQGLANLGNVGTKVFAGIAIGATAAAGVFALVAANAVKAAAKMETIGVSLKTAMGGSAEAAAEAQKNIVVFAAKTPYELGEITNAFIKLRNMGLDPSNRALEAYGNTASAMGKSLNDMVEAVADASTGEFERLKEFGIRAEQNGNKVKLTFKGVTTEIGKNSEEIQKYLIDLGNTNFAGGMEAQSKTLEGMMSTLSDSVSIKLAELGAKILPIIKPYIEQLINYLSSIDVNQMTSTIESVINTLTSIASWVQDNSTLLIGAVILITGAFTGLQIAMAYAAITAAGLTLGVVGLVPSLYAIAVASWAATAPLLPFVAIGATIAGAIAGIIWAFKNWETVVTFFQNSWTTSITWIRTSFDQQSQGVKTAILVLAAILLLPLAPIAMLGGAVYILYKMWQNYFAGIAETVNSTANTIRNVLASINLYDIGVNIAQGLITGLSDMIGAIRSKAQEIAGAVRDSIAGALNIQSPSRVAIQLMEYFGSGMVKGLDNSQSSVVQASQSLAGQVVAPISDTATSSATSGQNISNNKEINITVNLQSLIPDSQQAYEIVRILKSEIIKQTT